MSAQPCVSVIVPAFDLARYLPAALDSALAQDLGRPIEVIVVDDGSTDATPQLLDGYRDRVKVIRQANAGLVAAVDRGLREVQGEYIALLDADDEWPPDRLSRHVALLEANPLVGLVHGDMEVIDADGATLHPSFFARDGLRPSDGRVLGRLLADNFVSGGASTFRASLLPALYPIAGDAAYPDWWIATAIAAVAEIIHDPAVSNRYRSHGANMGLDADPARRRAIHRLELPWRRWMMWNLVDDDSVGVGDIAVALNTWCHGLRSAAEGYDGRMDELLESDPDGAAAALASADNGRSPSKTLVRAFSRDPLNMVLGRELEVALLREVHVPIAPSPPLINLDTRSRVTIAWLDEVVRDPGLLIGFAREALRDSDCTLAVLASPGADPTPLVRIVESSPLLSDERCDMRLLTAPATAPARALFTARSSARLSRLPHPGSEYARLPVHAAVERAATLAA